MTRAPKTAGEKTYRFAPRLNTQQIENGHVFVPKFDDNGLITCVITDAWSSDVLMLAHMDAQALGRTIETGEAWFYSRSRKKLWRKGEESGHSLRVVEMRVDCDQDSLWLRVEQVGPGVCHTGRRTCYYRSVHLNEPAGPTTGLEFRDADLTFDPKEVYGKKDKK
ncbi:MAG: phosphoribosyl-AMP cyclohydrolase [Xanthobacteraceae bacterium]